MSEQEDEGSDEGDMDDKNHHRGSLHKVDVESLNALVQQYEKVLDDNFNQRKQFIKFKDDYVKLRQRLQTLPDKLEYDAMVPISSKALCPGKIIHTNEVFVLLGENTFLECAAKTSVEIVNHRLKSVDDTLNRLEKERELFNSWKIEAERQMVETLGEGTTEIMEDYDEEKEKEWKKQHREKVRSYHQDLAKQREKTRNNPDTQSKNAEEEKLWTRLDALELEEDLMEAQFLYEQRQKDAGLPKENDAKIREKEKEPANENTYSPGKKVTFSSENIIHKLTEVGKKKVKDSDATTPKEEVELYKPSDISTDDGLYDPIFIRFRDVTSSASQDGDGDTHLVDSEDSDSEDEDFQAILSPSDIYERFGPPSLENKSNLVPGSDKAPLKSILKPRSKSPDDKRVSNSSNHDATESNGPSQNLVQESPVITLLSAKINERAPSDENPTTPPSDNNSLKKEAGVEITVSKKEAEGGRPLSLFKRMKAGRASPSE